MLPIIRSLDDIRRNTEQLSGDRFIIRCPGDSGSVEAFGRCPDPSWTANRSSIGVGRDWFYGADCPSYDVAVSMLRNGWKDGTAKVAKLAATIKAKMPNATKPVIRYRPTMAPRGQLVINIHDIATGGPHPFIGRFKTQERSVGRRIVKIAYNNCVSAGTAIDVIEARGACCMALVQILELLKFSVDLTIVTPSANGLFTWHVKPAGAAINADRLAFALIHSSSFRRLGFAMIEHAPARFHKNFYRHYGHVLAFDKSRGDWRDVAAKYDIIVDSECAYDDTGKLTRWTDPADQTRWLRALLREQGVMTAD